jgi:hypothetical protein
VLHQQGERMLAAPYRFLIEVPILGEVIEKDDCAIRPWWIRSLELAIHDVAVPCVEKQITRDERQYDDKYYFKISHQGETLSLFSGTGCPALSPGLF